MKVVGACCAAAAMRVCVNMSGGATMSRGPSQHVVRRLAGARLRSDAKAAPP